MYRAGERAQLIVNGYRHIGGYDLRTGKELWRLQGGGDIPVPTPLVANGLIYITNAHGMMAPIYAVKTSATGDISPKGDDTANEGLAWSKRRDSWECNRCKHLKWTLSDGRRKYHRRNLSPRRKRHLKRPRYKRLSNHERDSRGG